MVREGLPWGPSSKEFICQHRGRGFDPWSQIIPRAMGQLGLGSTTAEPEPCSLCSIAREPPRREAHSLHLEGSPRYPLAETRASQCGNKDPARLINNEIKNKKKVSVLEVATEVGVSAAVISRDLKKHTEHPLCRREAQAVYPSRRQEVSLYTAGMHIRVFLSLCSRVIELYINSYQHWDCLGVRWLRLCLPKPRGVGLIPGEGAKIPLALWPKHQKMKQKQYCNKLNEDSKNGPFKKIF